MKNRVPEPKIANPASLIRLVQIPNARDLDGEPRVALEMPRRQLLMFPTIAAALATKRMLEGSR